MGMNENIRKLRSKKREREQPVGHNPESICIIKTKIVKRAKTLGCTIAILCILRYDENAKTIKEQKTCYETEANVSWYQ